VLCIQCGNEIKSKLTGEFCTLCYFNLRKENKDDTTGNIRDSTGDNRETRSFNQGIENNDRIAESDDGLIKGEDKRDGISINESSGTDTIEIESEKLPSINKENETPIEGKKYCQSCIERGYGLNLAFRQWNNDYWLCEDCYQPLLDNILVPTDEDLRVKREIPVLDSNKPILNQYYEIMKYPEHLRFQSSDKALNARNDFFNYIAPALVNRDVMEIISDIEEKKTILFSIKYEIEYMQAYISQIKNSEREKANLSSIEKGKKEFSKSGPSKVKAGQDQKMADTLFKTIPKAEDRLKMYLDLQKKAREEEFKKRTGT
jgi:hypothetical protein